MNDLRTIQDVATEILTDTPDKFYIFGGSEYGLKSKYIEIMKSHYGGRVREMPTVDSVFGLMSHKQLIPLLPSLYIVRYDLDFVKAVDGTTHKYIESLNIIGTIVCIYDSPSHLSKLNKHLPQYTVIIDEVSPKVRHKYLCTDYSGLSPRCVDMIVNCSSSYYQNDTLCRALSYLSEHTLDSMSNTDILNTFGYTQNDAETQFKNNIINRNYRKLLISLSSLPDLELVYYWIFQSLMNIEKMLHTEYRSNYTHKRSKPPWTLEDVYNMFTDTYNHFINHRKYADSTEYDIIFLISLLQYKNIPLIRE